MKKDELYWAGQAQPDPEQHQFRTGPELRRKDSVRTAPVHVSGFL